MRDVVFIHGMWCTGDQWKAMRREFEAAGYRCHTPTLPAHEAGRDDLPVGALSLRDYREWLEQWWRAQSFASRPILVGHSMGGLLAQQLAETFDPLALVLLTPAAPAGILSLRPISAIAFTPVMLNWGFWRKPHLLTPAGAAAHACNGLPAERRAEVIRTLVPESGRALAEIAFWFLDRSGAARVDTSRIDCPVFVVSAGRDHLTPAGVVRRVATQYPGAALRYYADRCHWVIDDAATSDMCNDLIGWLRVRETHEAQALAKAGRTAESMRATGV